MDQNSILALTGIVTNAMGTITSATTQQAQGAATNRAAGMQAVGVTYRAESAAAIGEYRAGVTEWAAETNQGFAMRRADRIEAEAAAQAEIITRSTSRVMGRASAAYAASGVSGGSSLWVLNDIATEGQLQADLAIYGAKVQAGDIRQQSKFDTQAAGAQASIYRAMAEIERTSGQIGAAALYAGGQAAADAATMGAGATLLTGLGKAGMQVADMFSKGPEANPANVGGAGGAANSPASIAPVGATAVPVASVTY